MREVQESVADDLSEPPDGLDAEEWRVVLSFLAPDDPYGAGTPESPEVLPRGGKAGRDGAAGGSRARAVGGEAWRLSAAAQAQRCYPALSRPRALHRFNAVLARPHVRLAVDSYREAEAVAVADHRAVLRARALELLDAPPPLGVAVPDPETGEARVVPTSARDLAAWQMAQVATMRFLCDLDGHWAKDREEAAQRCLADARALREHRDAPGSLTRGDADVQADLAGKLALASRRPTPPDQREGVDGVARE